MFKVGDKVRYNGCNTGSFSTGDILTVLYVLHPSFTNEYLVLEEATQAGPMSAKHFTIVANNGLTRALIKLRDPRKATRELVDKMRAVMHKSPAIK